MEIGRAGAVSARPERSSGLDICAAILFTAPTIREELKLRAADRDPQRCKEIPEANIRQRSAPPGAFLHCAGL